ncbi:MAG: hypothetical protein AAGG51_19830 [Cyanobacteria bacterium P01_G01_bin.54]
MSSQISTLLSSVEHSNPEAIVLDGLAYLAQCKGNQAFMTRSTHISSFDSMWPIDFYSKGKLLQLSMPPQEYDSDGATSPFLDYLSMIYVWGYGSLAFNIDFSVFAMLEPKLTYSLPLLLNSNCL